MDASALRTWKTDVAVGVLLTAAVLVLLVGGIAGLAQHAAQVWWRAEGLVGDQEMYSLSLHTMSMVGVGMVALVTASVLVVSGRVALAVAVLAGVVAGPMTLVAAPVSESLIRDDDMDTTRGWRLLVGVAVLGALAAGTWWTSRSLRRGGVLLNRVSSPGFSAGSLFVLVAGAVLTAQVPMMGNQERPQLVVAAGWSLLIAGGAVVGTSLRTWQVGLATVGSGVVLLLMAFAYLRIGGWPGVAGWEFKGIQSPVILTSVTAAGFAAGPLLGFLATVRGRVRRPAPLAS
jgi:hypothetical protein